MRASWLIFPWKPIKNGYHREQGFRTIKKLAPRYLTTTKEVTPGIKPLQALYYRWGIFVCRPQMYTPHPPSEWLGGISKAGRRGTRQTHPEPVSLPSLAPRHTGRSVAKKRNATHGYCFPFLLSAPSRRAPLSRSSRPRTRSPQKKI